MPSIKAPDAEAQNYTLLLMAQLQQPGMSADFEVAYEKVVQHACQGPDEQKADLYALFVETVDPYSRMANMYAQVYAALQKNRERFHG